jgi:hypothetical protein
VAVAGLVSLSPVYAQVSAPELPRRTAEYVRGFVEGLSNVVAQEDIELRPPGGRALRVQIRSDLLLVRYPGSEQDWLIFRDVTHVRGKPVGERPQRLTQLFLEPFDDTLRRAREISLDSARYVPAVLNPLFAISFLQGALQPRFRFTIKDAGRQWPSDVKAMTFVETARPTLLRDARRGIARLGDAPTNGTAWIEQTTGRVLRTQMHVRAGGQTTTIETTFEQDTRLGIMAPAGMRTRNPDAVATYGNFRRFTVQTAIAAPTNE